jgi:hypothetical protein
MLFYTLIEYDTINLPTESSIYILNPDIIIDDNFLQVDKSIMSIATLLTILVIAGVIALLLELLSTIYVGILDYP